LFFVSIKYREIVLIQFLQEVLVKFQWKKTKTKNETMPMFASSDSGKEAGGRHERRVSHHPATPEELNAFQESAKLVNCHLDWNGTVSTGGEVPIDQGGEMGRWATDLTATDMAAVGTHVAVAAALAGSEEAKRIRMRGAKRSLRNSGIAKPTMVEQVMAAGLVVFQVMAREGSCIEVAAVGDCDPFGTENNPNLRTTFTVDMKLVGFSLVLKIGGPMWVSIKNGERKRAKNARKRSGSSSGSNISGEYSSDSSGIGSSSSCGDDSSDSSTYDNDFKVMSDDVKSKKRRRGGGAATAAANTSASMEKGAASVDPLSEMSSPPVVPITSHLRGFSDFDGVNRLCSNPKAYEERLRTVQMLLRMWSPEQHESHLRDLVPDYDGFHDEWTAALEPGAVDWIQRKGTEATDYSGVSSLFGCPILDRKVLELALRGKYSLTASARSTNSKVDRTTFINLDAFTAAGWAIPDRGKGYDVQSRMWLEAVVDRLATFHAATFQDPAYLRCFDAVKARLKGPKKEDSSIAYLGGNVEMALARFYSMAAGFRPMAARWRGTVPSDLEKSQGLHRIMAKQLKEEVDWAMSDEALKSAWPHEQFFLDWDKKFGAIGSANYSSPNKKHGGMIGTSSTNTTASSETGNSDAGTSAAAGSAKKKSVTKRARRQLAKKNGTAAPAVATTPVATAAAYGGSPKPPAASGVGSPATTRLPRAEQPCMKHVLLTTGLSKDQCPRGAECPFAHWKKGKISAKDVEGTHWIPILAENPTLLGLINSQQSNKY
jgi:hypothetical protein